MLKLIVLGDFNDGIAGILETNVLESKCSNQETEQNVPNLCINTIL
jgi:hypothetical protein